MSLILAQVNKLINLCRAVGLPVTVSLGNVQQVVLAIFVFWSLVMLLACLVIYFNSLVIYESMSLWVTSSSSWVTLVSWCLSKWWWQPTVGCKVEIPGRCLNGGRTDPCSGSVSWWRRWGVCYLAAWWYGGLVGCHSHRFVVVQTSRSFLKILFDCLLWIHRDLSYLHDIDLPLFLHSFNPPATDMIWWSTYRSDVQSFCPSFFWRSEEWKAWLCCEPLLALTTGH